MAIDQQRLQHEYLFTGRGTAGELILALEQVGPIEAKLKARPARVRWVALIVFLILAASPFAGGPNLSFLTFVTPIALLIYSAFMDKGVVLHDRVELLRRTLTMLNNDAASRGRFEVQLRLRPNKTKVSEGPNPGKGGGKLVLFHDAWLTVKGKLSDGTAISESFVDLTRQRTRRGSSGKMKTKERRLCSIRLQLKYNTALYGNASGLSGRLQKPFRLPAATIVKAVKTNDTSFDIKATVKGDVTSGPLHAASEAVWLGAYRILNLARRRVVAKGGAK